MATKNPKATTAITKWDEELAKQAEAAAAMTRSGGGKFFSLKGGRLSWNDAELPGNQMAVVIVASVLENVFYEGKFDPESQQGPKCFAFGTKEAEMAPHENVVAAGQAVNDKCATCPNNAWGSADQGKGKACRNTVRLALLPAGTFNAKGKLELVDEESEVATAEVGLLRLPVTSVKGYDTFVKQVAGALKRPPHGVITKVSVVPDAKTQFRVVFEPLQNVPNELMGAVMARREAEVATIVQPYDLSREESAPAAKGKGAKGNVKKTRKY